MCSYFLNQVCIYSNSNPTESTSLSLRGARGGGGARGDQTNQPYIILHLLSRIPHTEPSIAMVDSLPPLLSLSLYPVRESFRWRGIYIPYAAIRCVAYSSWLLFIDLTYVSYPILSSFLPTPTVKAKAKPTPTPFNVTRAHACMHGALRERKELRLTTLESNDHGGTEITMSFSFISRDRDSIRIRHFTEEETWHEGIEGVWNLDTLYGD